MDKNKNFSFGGKNAISKSNGRFKSDLMSGTSKNGSQYLRSYGITNNGQKWGSASFTKKVNISKGKNKGKIGYIKTTVFKTSKFINPKRK